MSCWSVSIKFDRLFDTYYLFHLSNLIKDSGGYLRWKTKRFVSRAKSELSSMPRSLSVITIRHVFHKRVSLEWALWLFESLIVEFSLLIRITGIKWITSSKEIIFVTYFSVMFLWCRFAVCFNQLWNNSYTALYHVVFKLLV